MPEYDLLFAAAPLKQKQEEMLGHMTACYDLLYRLGEEGRKLRDEWKGEAAESFLTGFWEEWGILEQLLKEVHRRIDDFAEWERRWEECERKAEAVIG